MLKLFEGRNDKISKLVKLGDMLGHSLRTNVNLFSVDSYSNTAIYLTEDEKLIKGQFRFTDLDYILEGIEIEDSEVFTDDERFDSYQQNQIALFVESLHTDDPNSAKFHFDGVVHLWEERARYNSTSTKIKYKTEVFNVTHNLLNTPEAARLFEVIPTLVQYLKENKEKIEDIPEIKNAIKLSETVAKAFNIPSTTYDDLTSVGRFALTESSEDNTYEIICQQELIRKEILEAKDNFETVWMTEPVISNLATKVNAPDDELEQALVEAITEIPYLALVSKRKLSETIHNNLGEFAATVPLKDMKAFIARLFESKKPHKNQLIRLLSEEYGVNLQSIKEIPTFKSLANTQVVIFEALSRLAPKTSNLKKTLAEMATLLKTKNGVECIDINSILQQVFEASEYSFENVPLFERFQFDTISKDFVKISEDNYEGDEESVLAHEDAASPKDSKKKKLKSSKKENKDDTEDEDEEDSSEEESSDVDSVQKKKMKKEEESEIVSDTELMNSLAELERMLNGDDLPFDEEN
jgi:hypothetical protein